MNYPFPWREFAGLGMDMVAGRPRSPLRDSASIWQRAKVEPRLINHAAVPRNGSLLIAANHYQTRGVWIVWAAGLINLGVARRREGQVPRWLVTGELQLDQPNNRGPVIPGSAWVLQRVAQAYGFISLPLGNYASRAQAMRELFRALDGNEVVGVFPEGLGGTCAELGEPVEGFEKLVDQVSRRRIPIMPVAIYESEIYESQRSMCAQFGRLIEGATTGHLVMQEIARLLPIEMRGRFGRDGSLG